MAKFNEGMRVWESNLSKLALTIILITCKVEEPKAVKLTALLDRAGFGKYDKDMIEEQEREVL